MFSKLILIEQTSTVLINTSKLVKILYYGTMFQSFLILPLTYYNHDSNSLETNIIYQISELVLTSKSYFLNSCWTIKFKVSMKTIVSSSTLHCLFDSKEN